MSLSITMAYVYTNQLNKYVVCYIMHMDNIRMIGRGGLTFWSIWLNTSIRIKAYFLFPHRMAFQANLSVLLVMAIIFGNDASNAVKPNIVFILADDFGWSDVGFHNSRMLTPNIDELASYGVILDNYYVQPMCGPSRTSLLSGRYLVGRLIGDSGSMGNTYYTSVYMVVPGMGTISACHFDFNFIIALTQFLF